MGYLKTRTHLIFKGNLFLQPIYIVYKVINSIKCPFIQQHMESMV